MPVLILGALALAAWLLEARGSAAKGQAPSGAELRRGEPSAVPPGLFTTFVNAMKGPQETLSDLLDRAKTTSEAIRKDPGVGAALGLPAQVIDRLTLPEDQYAKIYGLQK